VHKTIIPIVEAPDGEVLQDTTAIIDALELRHPNRSIMPKDPVLLMLSRIVEFIIDEFWIATAMNSRWNDPASKQFVIREFGFRIGGSYGLEGDAAMQIGERVAGQMQSYLPMLGLADDDAQALVQRYFEACSIALDKAISPTSFAFGASPSLVDFCLYTGYYAHQYRDLGGAADFLKAHTPRLCYYLDNLSTAQSLDASHDWQLTDEFLDYLAVLAPPGATFAEGVMHGVGELVQGKGSGDVVEGIIAPFHVPLMGESWQRGSTSFAGWKLQRAQAVYASMQTHEQALADEILERIGWRYVMSSKPGYRLERRDYQICVA